jgi:hypothetical protein
MHSDELYPKHRGLIVALADERRSADLSLAAVLTPRRCVAIGHATARCLRVERTASCSSWAASSSPTGSPFFAAVKALDGLTFPNSK